MARGTNHTIDTDRSLVERSVEGDREAFAEIYRRYGDRIHTMCVHLVGDRERAADVCSDVFLSAGMRIHQLRDPDKLKSWLYAIARHEVYRGSKRSSRLTHVAEFDDMTDHTDDDHMVEGLHDADLARLLHEAATGLDDSDRTVLELELGGLSGDEIAQVLNTSTSSAHQATHRMRDRLNRSVGALMVARSGRGECDDLDGLLNRWSGEFDVLWRKRIARHIDGCDVCGERRRRIPATLLDGVAGATETIPAPSRVGEQIFDQLQLGGSVRRWSRSGFPGGSPSRARWFLPVAGVFLALAVATIFWSDPLGEGTRVLVSDQPEPTTTAAPTTSTTAAPTTTTSSTSTTAAPSTTLAPRPEPPVVVTPEPTVPDPAPTTTTTTLPPDVTAPTLRLVGPSVAAVAGYETSCSAAEGFWVAAADANGVAEVRLHWSNADVTGSIAIPETDPGVWEGYTNFFFGTDFRMLVWATATDPSGNVGESNQLDLPVCPTPLF